MPIKLFEDGDILTHTDVNQYFMDQALCVFADDSARDDAFGNESEGFPELAEGRICYLLSDRKIYIYTKTSTDPDPEVFEWTPQLALIEDDAVTTVKILNEAVTTAKIDDGAVTADKIGTGAVTSDKILNETIVNGDISASAAIAHTKLATTTAGNVLLGTTTTGVITGTALTGDVTITGAGVTTIGNGAVTAAKLGTDLTLAGTTKIEEIFEKASIVDAQPVASNGATLTLTITDGAVYYYTTATTRNVVLDIVTTGMLTQQAVTVMVAINSGSTAGKITEIKVNGATPTAIKWFGGNAYPAGSGSNAVDAYTVTVFRSGTNYTVFASQSKFA